MENPEAAVFPYKLLKKTSRSFYLSLRVLPDGMRRPIGLAYLLARTADTIADTGLVPASIRLRLLSHFRNAVTADQDDMLPDIRTAIESHGRPEEKELIAGIPPMLAALKQLQKNDRQAVCKVLNTLLSGMEFDLKTFPAENSGTIRSLDSIEELDRYTYSVAGCVGEFWTDMMIQHTAALRNADHTRLSELGVRFGKALQMTNILRDCAQDLRIGRCYLPRPLLEHFDLKTEQLLLPRHSHAARPLLHRLVRPTLDHFRAAVEYTTAIPPQYRRLKLACVWPIIIGLETLLTHIDNENWLDPSRPSKITRAKVYRILLASLPRAGSDEAIRNWANRLIARIEQKLPPSID